MHYTIQLPDNFETCDVRTLLEKRWRIPRKTRHFLRIRKNVLLNNQTALFHEKVQPSDQITLILEKGDYPRQEVLLGDPTQVKIIFEDEHLLIVNKPTNLKTHPNHPLEKDTLLNHVAAYLAPKKEQPAVIHRLDKETSGAIIFAKNPFILPLMGKLLEDQKIKRHYTALVDGQLSPKKGTITANIGKDRHDQRKRVAVKHPQGQTARTDYVVQKYIQKNSLINCQLQTGRTHQIRVHLASLGHPIIGDPLYHPSPKPGERLMLHARSLSFNHPLTFLPITVETKEDFF